MASMQASPLPSTRNPWQIQPPSDTRHTKNSPQARPQKGLPVSARTLTRDSELTTRAITSSTA